MAKLGCRGSVLGPFSFQSEYGGRRPDLAVGLGFSPKPLPGIIMGEGSPEAGFFSHHAARFAEPAE